MSKLDLTKAISDLEPMSRGALERVHGGGVLDSLVFGAWMAGVQADAIIGEWSGAARRSDDRLFRGVVSSGALTAGRARWRDSRNRRAARRGRGDRE